MCATLALPLLLPAHSSAQSDDEVEDEPLDEAEDEPLIDDSVEPTGRLDQAQGNEAFEAAHDEPLDEAAAAAAAFEAEGEDEQFLSAAELTDEQLNERLDTIGVYLEDLQRPTRMYYYGWLTVQTGLVVGQTAFALTEENKAARTDYIVGASISGASLLRILFTSFPGRYAYRRFRKMPTETRAQKELKLAAAENWLVSQAKSDALGVAWPAHVIGALVAVGAGIGVAAAYEHNLRAGVSRTLLTLLVAELQIHTRPTRAIRYSKRYSSSPTTVDLAFAPMVERYSQGLSLVGRF